MRHFGRHFPGNGNMGKCTRRKNKRMKFDFLFAGMYRCFHVFIIRLISLFDFCFKKYISLYFDFPIIAITAHDLAFGMTERGIQKPKNIMYTYLHTYKHRKRLMSINT